MKTHSLSIAILITLLFLFFLSGNAPGQKVVAVADTIDLTPLIPKTVNLLANDTIPPGDSIIVTGGSGGSGYIYGSKITGGFYTFVANPNGTQWSNSQVYYGHYTLRVFSPDSVFQVMGDLVFRIHARSCDSLYLNNINALFTVNGTHFYGTDRAKFEVPKFSGKSTIFLNTLWIGGMVDTTLFLAAQRYGQGAAGQQPYTKADFWPGPVMDSAAYSVYQDTAWAYIWNLKRSEIDYHISHWSDNGYQPIHDILTWPGNGDVAIGQAARLAPFYDRNLDGIYNPYDGDYPLIRGDQSLFFIFNDDRNTHTESLGRKMKVEVHGMAYEWDMPEDSAFNNTVFLNYEIFNRSDRTYTTTWIGTFTDFDIGYSNDDYVGCDVDRGFYYGYNGTPSDGNGQPGSYGDNPPAQSVAFLGGPLLDPDGYDNPSYDGDGIAGPSFHGECNIVSLNGSVITMHYGPNDSLSGQFKISSDAINGINFGDGIVDNERRGMNKFVYCNNSNAGVPIYMTDPLYAPDYYRFMQGIWKDDTKMYYGGNANRIDPHSYGPDCDFMFPGVSDLCDWGTAGVPPNGPKLWNETTAGNPPQDRRGMGSTGPFTFHPGDVEELDLAFGFARDYGVKNADSSLSKLQHMTDIVRNAFITKKLPDGTPFFSGITEKDPLSGNRVTCYPNPANTIVNIRFEKLLNQPVTIRLVNVNGSVVRSLVGKPNARSVSFDVSGLPAGLYLVTMQSDNQVITKKVAVIR
jgi:hypothetical protein